MKRPGPRLRLHMGCGEGLTGRVRAPQRGWPRAQANPPRPAGPKSGKDKR